MGTRFLLLALFVLVGCAGAPMAPAVDTAPAARPGWHREAPLPELINGAVAAPQGLVFIGPTTLLLSVHQGDLVTLLYLLDTETGEFTGRATSAEFIHLNSLHARANGEVWGVAWVVSLQKNVPVRIDVAASFASQSITVDRMWDTAQLCGSVAFFWTGGVEYVACQEWQVDATAWLYVFRAAQMGAPVTAEDRVTRFDLGDRIQDIVQRPADGLLYVSRNAGGWVDAFDLGAAIATASDGAALPPVARRPHASRMPEGLAFQPGTGRLWSATEGQRQRGDRAEYAAVWTATW